MGKPKYVIGDLVATFLDMPDKKYEYVLIGWIFKIEEIPISERDVYNGNWYYSIEWADGVIEDDLSEDTIAVVVKVYRNAKRYNRWIRSNDLHRK